MEILKRNTLNNLFHGGDIVSSIGLRISPTSFVGNINGCDCRVDDHFGNDHGRMAAFGARTSGVESDPFFDLVNYLERYLYNFGDFMQNQFSHVQAGHLKDFIRVNSSATLLARTTSLPQPNAKKIREGEVS